MKYCGAAETIARSLRLDDVEEIEFATIIALLHDIARFEQYRIYGANSIDHANLGMRTRSV